ncbi:MAG: hypothetical protein Q9181_007211 [Wetmoreana brouardii]
MNPDISIPRLSLRGGGASSKRKEARKRKFDQLGEPTAGSGEGLNESTADPLTPTVGPGPGDSSTPSDEHHSDSAADEAIHSESNGPHLVDRDDQRRSSEDDPDSIKRSSQRFIVFVGMCDVYSIQTFTKDLDLVMVGNLPYSATDESIRQHFASLKPSSVRHRREKHTSRSKGFAFVEFSKYDRMKSCLKTFHHSSFHDGISPARKINVELTAGGGGSKSRGRRLKLKTKNEKLRQERSRRTLEQTKRHKKGKEAQKDAPAQSDNQDIHPSRKARVPALR